MVEQWTTEMWWAVYRFEEEGEGLASRTGKFYQGKFRNPVSPKDDFAITDCIDLRERRVLQYVLAILRPGRPSRMTVTTANTIFGALSGDQKVD